MKTVLTAALVLASGVCFAEGPLDSNELNDESCPGLVVDSRGDSLECRRAANFSAVKSAKVGENVRDLRDVGIELDWYGAIELGVLPDADTSQVYGYNRKLLDHRSGRLVGILSSEMYVNDEMEVRIKLVSRYNKAGKLVSVRVD